MKKEVKLGLRAVQWGGSISLLLFVVLYFLHAKPVSYQWYQHQIGKRVHKRMVQMDQAMDFVDQTIASKGLDHLWFQNKTAKGYLNRHIHLFVTSDDSLMYWNSNLISGADSIRNDSTDARLVKLNNAWCIRKSKIVGKYKVHAYYVVKYVYRINNELINSHFTEAELPARSSIELKKGDKQINIDDATGHFLFGIRPSENLTGHKLYRTFAFIAFNLFILFVLAWFYLKISDEIKKYRRLWYLMGLIGFSLVVLVLLQVFSWPGIFFSLKLFSPMVFAMPFGFNSLGVLLYATIFWLSIAFAVYRHIHFKWETVSEFWKIILGVVLYAFFILISKLFLLVIDHSVINFELYRLQETDGFSFLVYLIFFGLFGGWMLFAIWGIKRAKLAHRKMFYLILLVPLVLLSAYAFTNKQFELIYAGFSGYLLIGISAYLIRDSKVKFNYLHFFLYTFIFSNMLVVFVWLHARANTFEKQKTTLVNVSEGWFSERDRFSEILLSRMWKRISKDKTLKRMVCAYEPNPMEVKEYLDSYYFLGHWGKYDVQVVICWPDADLDIVETGERTACYPYFNEMIQQDCERLGNTDFYYQNNRNGRISYFGWLKFNADRENEASLFIDIESKPSSKGVGYPELLVDRSSGTNLQGLNYDFARYHSNHLISFTGDYRYNTSASWIPKFETEFYRFNLNGYNHLVYQPEKEDYIVLSSKVRPWYNYLLFLTYVYLYAFGIVSLAFLLYLILYRHTVFSRTFAGRIRFVMLGTLLFAFVLIAVASIFFNVQQVQQKQFDTITDKSRSVMMFLDQFVGDVNDLKDVDEDYLEDLLQNLSNGLYLDVNLYSDNGQLLSSSRPLIFDYNIIGRRMATEAFNSLHYNNTNMLIIEEGLGNFKYLSAYFMIYNWENNLLGYVNVPFFISGDELRAETSNFIVVIINIYLVFVLIALFITIILIRNLTKPLRMIQDKLSSLKFTGTNDMIEYHQEDEIGDLIKEYNRMAHELTRSAEELASNQRKLAWREMARQIAHEIKNPLTPMKLNLQQLQRAKVQQRDDFDQVFNKTAQTIIEQIDNLARIASEFSDFAKMPEAKPNAVDLIQRLAGVVRLFKPSSNIEFEFNHQDHEPVFVYADGEQLVQVFNNLIKNAIQAMPPDREGKIVVALNVVNTNVQVMIADNGKGIDENLRSKIFRPNFTTKSSGMGLGLAIARNIVINAGGDIWFETALNEGTTFYIKLPVYIN